MTIKWSDVINEPAYQALSPAEKAQAQEQYFNEVVAPQAGDHVLEARGQFYEQYPTASQSQLWTRTNFNDGPIGKAWEALTGSQRDTETMDKLKPVGDAPELNELSTLAAKMGWMQIFGSDQSQMNVLKDMGAKFRQDEKGNMVVQLPSGEYALNKPGLSPQDVASLIGESAVIAPAASVSAPLWAASALGGTELAKEGVTSALGGEDINPKEVGLAALTGFLPEFLRAGAGKAAAGAGEHLAASESAAISAIKYADDAEAARILSELSPEAVAQVLTKQGAAQEAAIQEMADRTGHSIGELTGAVNALKAQSAESMVDVTKSALRGDLEALAAKAETSEERSQIAQELGLNPDALPASFLSDNRQFIEFYQALKQMPGSVLSPVEEQSLKDISNVADAMIEQYGGLTDLSQLDEQVRSRFEDVIEGLKAQSEGAYESVMSRINPTTQAPIFTTLKAIEKELAWVGGNENLLSKPSRAILKELSSVEDASGLMNSPTIGAVDTVRQEIGRALNAMEGPYSNADKGKLKLLYGTLTEDLDRRFKSIRVFRDVEAARDLTAKMKEMQRQSINLFGRDIANSILPKLKDAVASATQGNAAKIKKLMKSLPEDQRTPVAVSALHYLFNAGARGGDRALALPGFVKGYEGLLRNQEARKALMENLPVDAVENLDKFYTFAKGVNDAVGAVPKTGIVGTIKGEFAAADTLAEKILTGDVSPKAELLDKVLSATPGVGGVYSMVKGGVKIGAKTAAGTAPQERMKAGIDLLASPEFKQAAQAYAKRKVTSEIALKQANDALAASRRWNAWLALTTTAEKAMIKAVGPIKFIAYWSSLAQAKDDGKEAYEQ